MSHRIPIACVARLGEGDLAGLAVHIGDTGQALNAEATLAELIATALEALLHRNANAGYLGTRSLADLDKTLKRAAVGQEVVDDQDLVALGQETLTNDDRVLLLLGKGVDGRGILLAVEVDGLRLLGKDNRHTAKMLSRDAGHANARSLNRQDLVDLDTLEQTGPLGAHVVEQLNVALVVEEGINLKDVTGLYDAVMANTILKLLHGATPSRGNDTARLINVVR